MILLAHKRDTLPYFSLGDIILCLDENPIVEIERRTFDKIVITAEAYRVACEYNNGRDWIRLHEIMVHTLSFGLNKSSRVEDLIQILPP